jgi:hypothetical protein
MRMVREELISTCEKETKDHLLEYTILREILYGCFVIYNLLLVLHPRL